MYEWVGLFTKSEVKGTQRNDRFISERSMEIGSLIVSSRRVHKLFPSLPASVHSEWVLNPPPIVLDLGALTAADGAKHGEVVDPLEDFEGDGGGGEDEEFGGGRVEEEGEGLGNEGVCFLGRKGEKGKRS
jgi:hypothetical protein